MKTKYHHRFPLSAHSSSILYCLGKLSSPQAPRSPPGALAPPAGPPQASERSLTPAHTPANGLGRRAAWRYPPATKTLQHASGGVRYSRCTGWRFGDQATTLSATETPLSEVQSNRVLSREASEELSKARPVTHLKVRPHHKVAAYLSDRLHSAILRHNKRYGRF